MAKVRVPSQHLTEECISRQSIDADIKELIELQHN